jgi:glycosyltransferase involved in cell wall biosynthesis
MKKLLILAPPFTSNGGITTFVNNLDAYWERDFKYIVRGNRGSRILTPFRMIWDYLSFFFFCFRNKNKYLILVNSSMVGKSIFRDTKFIKIARYFDMPIVLFLHGWNDQFFSTISDKSLETLFESERIFVLAEDFKKSLEQKGYKKPIHVETTIVNQELCDFFIKREKVDEVTKLLFLSRIEEEKGIIKALEAFKNLKGLYPKLELHIAGSGSHEAPMLQYIEENKLEDVTFYGFIRHEKKFQLFKDCDLFLFPSSYGEGKPISLLEAMTAGMPVISTDAGGIKDFYEPKNMGHLLKENTADELTKYIKEYLDDSALANRVGDFNFQYSRDHFLPQSTAKRLEGLFFG